MNKSVGRHIKSPFCVFIFILLYAFTDSMILILIRLYFYRKIHSNVKRVNIIIILYSFVLRYSS